VLGRVPKIIAQQACGRTLGANPSEPIQPNLMGGLDEPWRLGENRLSLTHPANPVGALAESRKLNADTPPPASLVSTS